MDGSQWFAGRGAGESKNGSSDGARARAAEDWLPPGAEVRAPAAMLNGNRQEPDPAPAISNSNGDADLTAFYERTSRLQACIEEMDRRARRVSQTVSSLRSVLPSRNGFVPPQARTAFVPQRPAQRSPRSRSKATAVPIRSIVEGWVPNRN